MTEFKCAGEMAYMRLTPSQLGMKLLLGQRLGFRMARESTLADRIREGHRMLVSVYKIDLGFDPQAWHDHLCSINAGGYRTRYQGHVTKEIGAALASTERQAAVAQLRSKVKHD